jgi:cardiolipin synthase
MQRTEMPEDVSGMAPLPASRQWIRCTEAALFAVVLLLSCTCRDLVYASTPCPPATVQFLPDERLSPALTNLVKRAKKEIWIGMFTFKAAGHRQSTTDGLIRELIRAHKRGVRVQLLLELPEDPRSELARDNKKSAERLKKAGVTVHWDRPDRRSHMKATVVDRRHLIVGSHNFTNSALGHNHELSVSVDSTCLAEEAVAYLKGIVREAGGQPL